jgi:hypothetical protein
MEKASPTHITKGKIRTGNLRTTIKNRRQRRTMGRQINTLGNGVSSIRATVITPLNVSQSSDW